MPVDQEPALRGGFAEYICVYNPGSIYLRTELPPEVAVLSEPFSVGVHGVSRGRPKIGDTVVVQGAGAIGLVTLIAARASGVGQAIVVGGPPGRLRLAEKLGADLTIDIAEVPDPEARKDLVRQATPKGEGADMVFECAGFLPAIPEGLDYLKRGGTYVEMGHFVDTGDFACNPNHMLMRKNLRLEAVWGYREEDFVRGSRILERNEFAFADMVSHMIPLERVAEGFEALHSGYRLDGEDAVKIAVRGGLA
jgi:threonine dehydrogenase-like Zn-dependent dehydrogenase